MSTPENTPESTARRFRVIRGHDETEFDYHEMVGGVGRRVSHGEYVQTVRRDAIGRGCNHGRVIWHVVICNNPDCGAEMLVQLDSVFAGLAKEAGL